MQLKPHLVGSTIVVWPGTSLPDRSASSIIENALRSLTLFAGFWLSSCRTQSVNQRRTDTASNVVCKRGAKRVP
jgi:hypothetical protein